MSLRHTCVRGESDTRIPADPYDNDFKIYSGLLTQAALVLTCAVTALGTLHASTTGQVMKIRL